VEKVMVKEVGNQNGISLWRQTAFGSSNFIIFTFVFVSHKISDEVLVLPSVL